jgi:uncharacterized membrane protein YsdA (DUF1294 family)
MPAAGIAENRDVDLDSLRCRRFADCPQQHRLWNVCLGQMVFTNNRHRISEASLLFVALIGGSVGAIIAQQTLRHKTRKEPFRSVLWGISVVQVIALVVLAVRRPAKGSFQEWPVPIGRTALNASWKPRALAGS